MKLVRVLINKLYFMICAIYLIQLSNNMAYKWKKMKIGSRAITYLKVVLSVSAEAKVILKTAFTHIAFDTCIQSHFT